MTLRTGVDLIEIHRVQQILERHGDRFLNRVYTAMELRQSLRNPQFLAGRFAAKEAVAKALGTGIGLVRWQDIEILGDEDHAPTLTLSGEAIRRAESLGLSEWSVSISHSMTHAVALAVAIGSSTPPR